MLQVTSFWQCPYTQLLDSPRMACGRSLRNLRLWHKHHLDPANLGPDPNVWQGERKFGRYPHEYDLFLNKNRSYSRLKTFFEETWLAAHLSPPLFLNSLHVLSCCRCTCICDNGRPLSRSFVSIADKNSIEALLSFLVSGRPTPKRQPWPCAMHATTCIRIFCSVLNSFPRVMGLLGSSNLDWSMPSATNTKVLERRRLRPLASQ